MLTEHLTQFKADLCKFHDKWPFQTRIFKGLLHTRFTPVLLFRLASFFYACRLGALVKRKRLGGLDVHVFSA